MKKYQLKTQKTALPKNYKINYEKELNESQRKAVMAINGPVLVIAGAGSGKTRTLIYRVARLIEEGIRPENILLLTFTRKAAREMLNRAQLLLDSRASKINGGTFHSFANSILRKYGKLIGIEPNFTILDRSDAEDAINLIRSELGLALKEIRFPKKNTILDIISKSINRRKSIKKVLDIEFPHFSEHAKKISMIKTKYEKFKQDRMLLDYDDLLVKLLELLSQKESLRRKLTGKYRYVMIDEYQDTNIIQAEIACLLAGEHRNIMAVGDDSQSIYSFRGAHFMNIMNFPKLFPETKIIKLEENYRSTQHILNLANKVIDAAAEKHEKNLYTKKISEILPGFIEAGSENQQSRFVVSRILEMREEGIALNEIAVLFRAGWHSNDLEIELAKHSIPFVKYGGFKFIETAHIKDVLAFLRVMHNPRDAVSWLRILLLFPGIGPRSANEMIVALTAGNYIDALQAARLGKEQAEALRYFIKLNTAKKEARAPVSSLINKILKIYTPLLENKYDDHHKRLSDINSLLRIAEQYDNLEKFLSDLTLEPLEISHTEANAENSDEEKLVLSTIHSAKGLEWDSVFIIFANDGFLPSARSLDSEDDIEEERRLLYVAITRAKNSLYIIKPNLEYAARSYFDESYWGLSKLSRFLDSRGIIDECFEHYALVDGEDESGSDDDGEIRYISSYD